MSSKPLRRKAGRVKKTQGPPAETALISKFPIVGIGASAGGLEAMMQLLKHLPADTGMAFVVVQHLDPTHESALSSLLSRATEMPVMEARNNVSLEVNHVYIIPPNKGMGILERRLKLFPRREGREEYMPIDMFFRSLAEEEGSKSVGIILSGNGADGTQGLLAIKAAGGITFAQDERSAKYPAMPGNAITAGCVDFVLTPEMMVRDLKRIGGRMGEGIPEEKPGEPAPGKAFEDILMLVRQRTGVDFTYYKHATLRRRIQRRMVLHKFESLKDYGNYLRGHATEVKELFNDILIHVTGFFRDTAVFQTLRKKLFPRLLKGKSMEDSLRIWIPGCSTGEEVYSVAITLMELMSEKKAVHPVQIFATDINDSALDKARAGFYQETIKTEIAADRLRRFFVRVDAGYRVNKSIREMCIFARQNLVSDPPFSNLDLISCRNVLIYLGPTLQRKVMPVFHYALRPTGLLMLGASETIGAFSDLFTLVDKKSKIYAKKSVQSRPSVSFGHELPEPSKGEKEVQPPMQITPTISEVQKQADRIVLTSYSLPGVVINAGLEVLQFRGRTGIFLEHAHGEATLNLLRMAREGLMPELRAAVAKTIKQNVRVRQEGLRVRQNGHFVECNIEIIPFTVPPGQEKFFLVLFEPSVSPPAETGRARARKSVAQRPTESAELAHLREELGATRESLQTIIEEQEATNEELRSANEEIMSSNEELQSTNEELETAKEELQSTNEELTTLNDELENRNGELEQVNNDLHNLLASVSIPIVILDGDLKIRRFTMMAEKLLKLIPGDIGRPITDIAMPVEIPALDKQVMDVFESLTPRDIEVQDKQGHWWSVRIRPYKTTDHKIDGAVLALVDIDAIKTKASYGNDGYKLAEAMASVSASPMMVMDNGLEVKAVNEAVCSFFKMKPDEAVGRRIFELSNRWHTPKLPMLLEEALKERTSNGEFQIECEYSHAGEEKLVLNGRRLVLDDNLGDLVLLSLKNE
ncbi:MAG TPA: chemotaxis protein CheB [Candidatus Sulfotelmatobacter sp.]|nr:chemotaxis protein CheB [Candidatus Sulfotelmatobacter sp.]